MMPAFFLSVLSGVVSTALLSALAWTLSDRPRRWTIRLLSRMTGLGIRQVYRQQSRANLDLDDDLRNARWIWIMTGRGNELTRDSFSSVWAGILPHLESVRILLPDPENGYWLTTRETTMRRTDTGLRPGLLAEQIRTNAAYIQEATRDNPSAVLRFYNLPNLYRVIATQDVAYLTFYEDATHARNSPCIVATRPGILYDFALQTLTTAWTASLPTA